MAPRTRAGLGRVSHVALSLAWAQREHVPKLKVQAAVALLDRAWGKPAQMIHADPDAPPTIQMLHLFAARTVTAELQTAFERDPLAALPPIVDGDAVPQPTSSRANGAGKTAPLDAARPAGF